MNATRNERKRNRGLAVGPQQGRKVFTLQTLPPCDAAFDEGVGKVAEFSPHAGVRRLPATFGPPRPQSDSCCRLRRVSEVRLLRLWE